jgi:hypothetical protein
MGKTWRGGKGDENRVTNHKSYRDNFDNISFGKGYRDSQTSAVQAKPACKPVETKKFLFLDDMRIPQNAYLWDENKDLKDASGVACNKWDIVRSYDEFTKWVDENGIPDVVSFDNDLFDVADDSVTNDELMVQFTMVGWENFSIKTGAHCAQYLVDACNTLGKPIPKYFVHTANNAARPIIRKILEDAKLQSTLQ